MLKVLFLLVRQEQMRIQWFSSRKYLQVNENDKLTSKNWKLTAGIYDLKLRLSDSEIRHKLNVKDIKSELKGSTSLRAVNFFLMVKITEVPTRSIDLNLFYRMQQKFRRSTVKKGRITLERNWLIDHGLTISTMGLRSRVIRPFLTVDRRNFCCIR